ncbi:MAG: 30S ribosome-binding factor RbfA [Desulfobulbaceae bacterium]|nr:30S ribosome-binding factor RbfA [Desulfobulbaceae bacterium]
MKKTKEIALPLGLGRRPKRRPQRVADLVMEELALLLLHGLKEPRLLNVTVTRVSMTDDLKQAIIYYTVMGSPRQEKEAAQGWERAKGFIRSHLAKQLQLRHAPEPVFKVDRNEAQQRRIEDLLTEIKKEDHEPSP